MLYIDATEIVGKAEPGVFHLICSPALELFHDLRTLAYPRGSQGMAAGQETPVGIYGNPAINMCFTGGDKRSSFTLFTETQLLDLDDLRNAETIVHLGHINVFRGQF